MKWRQIKKNDHLEWELAPKTKEEILKDAGKYADDYEKENGFTTHPKTASFHGYIAGYDAAKLDESNPPSEYNQDELWNDLLFDFFGEFYKNMFDGDKGEERLIKFKSKYFITPK